MEAAIQALLYKVFHTKLVITFPVENCCEDPVIYRLGLRTVPVIDGSTDGSDGQLPVSVWAWGTPVFIRVTAVRRVIDKFCDFTHN